MPGFSYRIYEFSLLLGGEKKLLMVTCLHWSASAKVTPKHEIPVQIYLKVSSKIFDVCRLNELKT